MSAVDTLRMLARGERPVQGLLHNCRLEGFGAEAYGEEAILERFRAAQFQLLDDAVVFEAGGHVAIFAEERALFADIAEGGIARIWALSGDAVATPEAGVSVAIDPDLSQARGDLYFAAADHPRLEAEGGAKLAEVGTRIARDNLGYRTRAFAIRAFGSADRGAALFAVYRLGGHDTRTAGFSCTAAGWGETAVLIVHDRAGAAMAAAAPWTPRIGG